MSKIKMLLDYSIDEVVRIANKEGFEIGNTIAIDILMTQYMGMTYTSLSEVDKYDHIVDYCISKFTNLYDGE